jgi:hypothetical protein
VLVAGVLAAAGGIAYLLNPRVGALLLLVVGTVAVTLSGLALALNGSVPWLLVAFWGASATLLAGLMHLIERGTTAELMSGVTVATVVAVLALSALGLGQYVRMTWSAEERATLEELPLGDEQPDGEPEASTGLAAGSLEPVPGGRWAAFRTYTGVDQAAMWSDMMARLRSCGWRIVEERDGRCMAIKNGFRLLLVAEQVGPVESGPSKRVAPGATQVAVEAYVWQDGPQEP